MDEDTHTLVLRRHRVYLQEKIEDPRYVIDHLYAETKQFTVYEKERIECKTTIIDRNRKLVKLISSKDKEFYNYFIIALDKVGQRHLIPRLRREEVIINLENELKFNYKEGQESTVSFDHINKEFQHEHKEYIDADQVITTVEKTFQQVKYEVKSRSFIGLACCDAEDKKLMAKAKQQLHTEVQSDDESDCRNDQAIQQWSEDDVCDWLKEIGVSNIDVLEKFRSLMINGEALLELTESDFKDELPELKLGQRKILLKRRKDLLLGKSDFRKVSKEPDRRCSDTKNLPELNVASKIASTIRTQEQESGVLAKAVNKEKQQLATTFNTDHTRTGLQQQTIKVEESEKSKIASTIKTQEQESGVLAKAVNKEKQQLATTFNTDHTRTGHQQQTSKVEESEKSKIDSTIRTQEQESGVLAKAVNKEKHQLTTTFNTDHTRTGHQQQTSKVEESEKSKNQSPVDPRIKKEHVEDNPSYSHEDSVNRAIIKHKPNQGLEHFNTIKRNEIYTCSLESEERFLLPFYDLSDSDKEIMMQKHLIQFICACLNSRLSGRFFLGIDKKFQAVGCKLPDNPKVYTKVLQDIIEKAFLSKKSMAAECVHAPIYTEVILEGSPHYVCEIRVNQDVNICLHQVFEVKLPKLGNKKTQRSIYGFVRGNLRNLMKDELKVFKQEIKELDATIEQKMIKEKPEETNEATKGCDVKTQTYSEGTESCTAENEISESRISTLYNKGPHSDTRFDHHKLDNIKSAQNVLPSDPIEKLNETQKSQKSVVTENTKLLHDTTESNVDDLNKEECITNESDKAMDKLRKLLCLGNDTAVNDLYPILVTSTPNDDIDLDHLSFIGKVPWKAVFQIGVGEKLIKLFENSSKVDTKIVPSADAFSPKSNSHMKNPEKLKSLCDDIEISLNAHFNQSYNGPHWIYTNNENSNTSLDVQQWNRDHRFGLKEAVNLYDNLIPRGRAVVVFLALSDDVSIMIEAMIEFISAFQDQWVLIAADENNIAKPIRDELLRRSFIEETGLKERSVTILHWEDVDRVIKQIYADKVIDSYKLTSTANGNFVIVNQQWKNRLSDLEILSANECENVELTEWKEEIEQEGLKYYNGAEVSWLNFKANTHVCRRDILWNLNQFVKDALKPYSIDETYVGKVLLYHQPGAGGTTVARNVLWDFKDKYRCAVVKNISEQTVHQIVEFRSHQDTNPNPVLLLIDNLDEEPSNVLVSQMEEKSKQIIRSEVNNDGNTPVCVFLICWRKNKLPHTRQESSYNQAYRGILGHNLSQREKSWWTEKSKELEKQDETYQRLGEDRVHPNLLISFNIMKSNFDKSVIERMTTHLVEKIEHPKERELLKYVALLNAFDINFRTIPSSSFDVMMMDFALSSLSNGKRKTRKRKQKAFVLFYVSCGPSGVFHDKGSHIRSWVSKLSLEFRLLMNDPSPFTQRSITNLRITNPLLSKEILKVLQHLEGNTQTMSGTALQLLECKEIFNVKGIARSRIISTVVDIMKRRERAPSGKPQTYFAPMIQYIVEHEDVERASTVMEKVFEISQDAFIAQHIARINIYSQNWEKAISFAGKATTILSESSILWDTRGRIYQRMLAEQHKTLSTSHYIELEKVAELVRTSYTGIKHFYKAQELSEREQIGFQNNVGYLGQLEITQLLFLCLSKAPCFQVRKTLTKFLLDEKCVPEDLNKVLQNIEAYERDQLLQNLREIVGGVEKAIRKLEDERMQLKDPVYLDEYRSRSELVNHDRLDEIKANLYDFLREDYILSDDLNVKHVKDACKIRSRKVRILGGNSFWSIFDLLAQIDGETRLMEIKELCLENVTTGLACAEDYEALIESCLALALVQCRSECNSQITYSDLAKWSKTLFSIRGTVRGGKIHLEPYLFYTMFNWPRENSGNHYIPKQELQVALEQWKGAYFTKYPKQRNPERKAVAKEGTTVYFFARGQEMSSIFKARELKKSVGQTSRGEAFWREPTVLRTLQRFNGVLRNEGEEVDITLKYPNGDKAVITIPTSLPKKDRRLWHKQVFFTIGFTWIGPKAFDVTREDPSIQFTETIDYEQLFLKDTKDKEGKRTQRITYNSLIELLSRTEDKLTKLTEKKKKVKTLTRNEERELKQLQRKVQSLDEQTQKIMERLEEF